MPRYTYTAIAADGKKAKGTITAESPYAARKQLRVRSIHPTSIAEITAAGEGKSALASVFGRTSKKQIIDFTRQMATLLKSGIKLTEALTVLTMQAPDSRFKNALTDIRDRVVTGESLTDAMKDYSDYFDIIYVSMVRVGEVTGSLGTVFDTIAGFMGKRQRVESKIITAMVYPAILMLAAVVVVLILTTFVIPKIGAQLVAARQQLPWITKQLMNVSYIMTSWWVLLVIAGNSRDYLGVQAVLQDASRGADAGQVPAVAAAVRPAYQTAGRRTVCLYAVDASGLRAEYG